MTEARRKGLGKGLSALLGEDSEDYARLDQVRTSKDVPIESLRPSRFQPRRHVSEEGIEDLARSVAEKGILQPILVRRLPNDPSAYEIIAGERRWRAAQKAALHRVPILIKDLSDREALEIALVENLQRQDLSALEEAEGYRRLMEEFDHTQEALAHSVGKSRSHVANTLRLLNLPEEVKGLVESGELSAGHARALLAAEDPATLARLVAKRGLNVRQTERLVKAPTAGPSARGTPTAPAKDRDTEALERDLSALLGLTVEIAFKGSSGTLTLHYRTLEQLDDILHRLSQGSRGPRPATADVNPAGVTPSAGDIDPDAALSPQDEAVETFLAEEDAVLEAEGLAEMANDTEFECEDETARKEVDMESLAGDGDERDPAMHGQSDVDMIGDDEPADGEAGGDEDTSPRPSSAPSA